MRALNFLFFLLLFSLILNGAAPNTNAPPADVNATDQNSSDNLTGGASASEIEEGEKDKKKSGKKSKKKTLDLNDDPAIVVIDDSLKVDTEKELEERRAYLEEARSQEAGD